MSYSGLGLLSLVRTTIPIVKTVTTKIPVFAPAQTPDLRSSVLLPSRTLPEIPAVNTVPAVQTIYPVTLVTPAVPTTSSDRSATMDTRGSSSSVLNSFATITQDKSTPSATTSRVLTNPATSLRIVGTPSKERSVPSIPGGGIITSPLAPDAAAAIPRPDGSAGQEMAAKAGELSEFEARQYGEYSYRAVPAAGAALLESLVFPFAFGTGQPMDVMNVSWQRFVIDKSGAGIGFKASDMFAEMKSQGAVLITAFEDGSLGLYATNSIQEVSSLTMGNTKILLFAEPPGGWGEAAKAGASNALLYGGIAVAAVAGIGLVIYLSKRN
jgi:hypothetical protein